LVTWKCAVLPAATGRRLPAVSSGAGARGGSAITATVNAIGKPMALKLDQLDAKLRARIEAQLAQEDAARRGALRPVPPAVAEPVRRASAPTHARQSRCTRRLVVSLIGLRRRTLDDDNFNGACKHLRDAIAASLGLDDGDKRITWQYQQLQTRGREGVLVHIEVI